MKQTFHARKEKKVQPTSEVFTHKKKVYFWHICIPTKESNTSRLVNLLL